MKTTFKWGIFGPGRIAKKFASAVWKIPSRAVKLSVESETENRKLEQTYSVHFKMLKLANNQQVYP
ncbi:MAG: hypothetical protein J7K66_02115 [Anaerolineaceae bacterium]|nr:hypothetical protein [Anaerolineaceae bacterium]